MLIILKLLDQEIVVLLDSGVTSSVIGAKGLCILERLGLKVYPASLKNISTADGAQKPVEGLVDLPTVVRSSQRYWFPRFRIILFLDVTLQRNLSFR